MLILKVKANQEVTIDAPDGTIRIFVDNTNGANTYKLAIDAPREYLVLRGEVKKPTKRQGAFDETDEERNLLDRIFDR